MKHITIILLSLFSIHLSSQGLQNNAPWMKNSQLSKSSKKTFKEITDAAEAYFNTIDKFKKGSGLKPYERWKYQNSFFVKPDGYLATHKDLMKAWKKKNTMKTHQKSTNNLSDWTSIGPHTNININSQTNTGQGRVNTIAEDPSDPNTLYIGAPAGGIWKSIDSGANWVPLTDYLPQIGVSGIAIHPTNSDIIYIATGDDDSGNSSAVGVWKSVDGGTTWNITGDLAGDPNSMNEIYIHPDNHETVLVATSTGVHKTTNGGTNWVRKLNANIIDIKMKPGDPTIWYAASGSNIYRSEDSGETFNPATVPSSVTDNSDKIVMDVTPANPNLVYFVSSNGSQDFNGIYKSTDDGENFSRTNEFDNIFEVGQAWYDLAFAVSDTDPDELYVGELNIWKSTDGGDDFTKINSWNAFNDPNYTHADIHFMRFFNGRLYAGTDGGIYKSLDGGDSFESLIAGLTIGQFYKISVAAQNSGNIAGGLQDNGGFARYQNNWTHWHGGDGMDNSVNPIDPKNYFGFIQFGGTIFETEDGGLTKKPGIPAPQQEVFRDPVTGDLIDSGGEWVTPMTSNSQGLIYAGYKELYKLEDFGTFSAWIQVSNESFSDDIDQIEIDPKNDNNIFVSEKNRLFRSTDAGANFTELVFPSGGNINAIEISNTDSNVAWVVTNWVVYKTSNLLDPTPSFIDITSNLPYIMEPKLVIKHHERSGNNTVYIGTALGVYTINDDLTEWQSYDTNLPNVSIRDLEINEEDALLIAATYGRGVFQTSIPEQLPDHDVKLVSINNLANKVHCGPISVNITVKNKGINPVTDITINYTVDNGSANTYNWSGNLASSETTDITLPDFSASKGSHTLFVDITTNNDAYDTNNFKSSTFLANESNDTPTTVNSFEDEINDALNTVTVENENNPVWIIATPSKNLLNSAASGDKAYITKATGNYPDNTISYLYTECYDLSSMSNPVLSFKMGFDIETDWDYMLVEYSTNGEDWNTLGNATDPNWYTSSSMVNGLPGNQWTGVGENPHPNGATNAAYHNYSYDLGAFVNESNIIFRFKFFTDTATNEEGVVIDDLVIEGVLSVSNEDLLKSLIIYPNPSKDIFNIRWNTNETATVDVYNYLGKLIVREKSSQADQHSLNLNGHARGLYLVKIATGNKQAIKKIVLE